MAEWIAFIGTLIVPVWCGLRLLLDHLQEKRNEKV